MSRINTLIKLLHKERTYNKDICCGVAFNRWVNDSDLAIVIEALEKSEKYKWHDLSEDPEDLPNKDRGIYTGIKDDDDELILSDRVRVIFDDGFTMCGYFFKSRMEPYQWCFGEHFNSNPNGWIQAKNVETHNIVAWKYIEPFKKKCEE